MSLRPPPGADRFPFLDHAGPIAFAHRGGAHERPENTWASFSHAYELGYRYMESDVHATADDVAVLIHDPDLRRLAGRDERVERLTWAELQTHTGGGEAVPRLDEALERWPDARWNLDAKADRSVDVMVETIRRTGTVDRVCVTSFSDARLTRIQQALGPRVCTALGPNTLTALRLASLLPSRVPLGDRFSAFGAVQAPVRWGLAPVVDRRFVATAHRAGLAVHVWTIDTVPVMRRLLDLGVDGIMSDEPTLLRDVLTERGFWPG
jgi:glycerophosphoryl diester phosphodiesterase